MPKYRLIGFGVRRSAICLEDKIQALAEVLVRERPVREVLKPLYEKDDKDLPKNTSAMLSAWKRSIQDRLNAEDPKTIDLCRRFGIIEEGEAPTKRPRKKREK